MKNLTILKKIKNSEDVTFIDGQTYAFCDFRGLQFQNIKVTNVTFIGCYFGNVIFKNSIVENSLFQGCLSLWEDEPIDLNKYNSRFINCEFLKCQMIFINENDEGVVYEIWDDETDDLVYEFLNFEDIERQHHFQNIKDQPLSKQQLFAVPFALILLDSNESRRLSGFSFLKHQIKNKNLPYHENLFEVACYYLMGDEELYQYIATFIKEQKPKANLLSPFIDDIYSSSTDKILKSISYFKNLVSMEGVGYDHDFSNLVDPEKINKLLFHENKKVKLITLNIVDYTNNLEVLNGLIHCLNDHDPEIIKETLKTIMWGTYDVPTNMLLPYLKSNDDSIQFYALQILHKQAYRFKELGVVPYKNMIPFLNHSDDSMRRFALIILILQNDILKPEVNHIIQKDSSGLLMNILNKHTIKAKTPKVIPEKD